MTIIGEKTPQNVSFTRRSIRRRYLQLRSVKLRSRLMFAVKIPAKYPAYSRITRGAGGAVRYFATFSGKTNDAGFYFIAHPSIGNELSQPLEEHM